MSLPSQEETSLLRDWRAAGLNEPIVVFSGRDNAAQRVAGLRAGADDYLIKPFVVDELHARIDAIARRGARFVAPEFRVGKLTFDIQTKQFLVNDRPVELSKREADIMNVLIHSRNKATPRQLLEDQLVGSIDGGTSNPLAVHIHRLRRKIEAYGEVSIRAVRGVGYMLVVRRS